MSRTQSHASKAAAGAKAPEQTPEQKKAEAKARAKAKRDANRRVFYPGLEAQEQTNARTGKKTVRATKKLDAVPADFDPKLHRNLTRADFSDESAFFEMKAQELDQKAAALRKQASDVKALGGIKDRAAAKKLLSLQKRMDEMMADLAGKGVDLGPIKEKLAAAMAKKAEQAATPATSA